MPSRNKIIIIGVVGFAGLIFFLVFIGAVPGLRNRNDPQLVTATIRMWGVEDNKDAYRDAFDAFKNVYPNVTIEYSAFADADLYEEAVLEALAAGVGPDIFMIRNNGVPRQVNRLYPASAEKISLGTVRGLFPKTVEQDFVPEDRVYALPLSIDTLALVYNRDFFDQEGLVTPVTWEEFKTAIPKITKIDPTGRKITRAGAAIGGSMKSIPNAADIVSLLMLQTGTQMVSPDFSSATFSSDEGEDALEFYITFADAREKTYTWNDTFPEAREAFLRGAVSVIFEYAAGVRNLTEREPFFDMVVAPVPQLKEAQVSVSYPSYWGYAVSRQSRVRNLSWDFVVFLTTNEETAAQYTEFTGRPPALRSLIQDYANDLDIGVFAKQALFARSWPQIDNRAIGDIFSTMIQVAASNRSALRSALEEAENKVTQLMQRRAF